MSNPKKSSSDSGFQILRCQQCSLAKPSTSNTLGMFRVYITHRQVILRCRNQRCGTSYHFKLDYVGEPAEPIKVMQGKKELEFIPWR